MFFCWCMDWISLKLDVINCSKHVFLRPASDCTDFLCWNCTLYCGRRWFCGWWWAGMICNHRVLFNYITRSNGSIDIIIWWTATQLGPPSPSPPVPYPICNRKSWHGYNLQFPTSLRNLISITAQLYRVNYNYVWIPKFLLITWNLSVVCCELIGIEVLLVNYVLLVISTSERYVIPTWMLATWTCLKSVSAYFKMDLYLEMNCVLELFLLKDFIQYKVNIQICLISWITLLKNNEIPVCLQQCSSNWWREWIAIDEESECNTVHTHCLECNTVHTLCLECNTEHTLSSVCMSGTLSEKDCMSAKWKLTVWKLTFWKLYVCKMNGTLSENFECMSPVV